MDLGLAGKTAIVTGASRGIGFATAQRLAAEGAAVAICARDPERLEAAVQRLRQTGAKAVGVVADTTKPEQREALVSAVVDKLGPPDILVNNAGTHVRATVDDMSDDQLRRQLEDKVFGFFGMIRAVLPHMRRLGGGRIVNVIGQAVRHPHPDRLPSGITNAAAQAMSKAVADAVARENIRVNTVCPQYIETEIVSGMIKKEMRERGVTRDEAAAGFTRANVLGRLGQPGEIADLIAWVASDRADFVTGSSISIDGGYARYVFG
jgi:NAD(P)-dependent dehydrogenase (short-subunit alcohol dehydrogenase family)